MKQLRLLKLILWIHFNTMLLILVFYMVYVGQFRTLEASATCIVEPKTDTTVDRLLSKSPLENERNLTDDAFLINRKWITGTFPWHCNVGGYGLGNVLFRWVSLYGLGRSLNRIPFALIDEHSCHWRRVFDLRRHLPRFADVVDLKIVESNRADIRYAKFGDRCCLADNVSRLAVYRETYLILSGEYLQSSLYFDKYRSDLLSLLKFGSETTQKANAMAKRYFSPSPSHNFCIHIRRGDFLWQRDHNPTNEPFLRHTIPFIAAHMQKKHHISNITLVALGNDPTWARNVFRQFEDRFMVSIPPMSPDAMLDIAMGALHCSTILLSASASTMGFWPAYMGRPKLVYYNAIAFRQALREQHHAEHYFPHHWTGVLYEHRTGKVEFLDRAMRYNKYT